MKYHDKHTLDILERESNVLLAEISFRRKDAANKLGKLEDHALIHVILDHINSLMDSIARKAFIDGILEAVAAQKESEEMHTRNPNVMGHHEC